LRCKVKIFPRLSYVNFSLYLMPKTKAPPQYFLPAWLK
jgi:hypothetical protein